MNILMPTLIKKLTSKEILNKLLKLKQGQTFSVWTRSERVSAMRTAKTLRDCGRIDHVISSRKNESGEFIIYIVPNGK